MWVTPYGLGVRSYTGTALIRPNIVSVAPLISDTATDWTTQTFNFDSPTGNIVVLASTRCNAGTPDGFSATWNGDALTEEEDVEINAVNAGLGNLGLFTLAMDPSDPATLYAGTGSGVYRTTTGGL